MSNTMTDRITSAAFQPEARVIQGDALAVLRTLEAESVHCVVTSPPYWGLRSYSTEGQVWGGDAACEHSWEERPPRRARTPNDAPNSLVQQGNQGTFHELPKTNSCLHCNAWRGELGLEPSPALYVEHIVEIFREVRRVLRPDGTLWLNIGDSYVAGPTGHQDISKANGKAADMFAKGGRYRVDNLRKDAAKAREWGGLKPKDKCMIPARVAIALQDDGWYLRQEIVWCKRAPMPESTRDRPTTAHEMVYLFAKSGDTTYYTHPHKPGVRGEVPPPDYRWHDNVTGERTAIEPEGWRTELMEGGKTKRWRRINLWEGHDYFYDQEAERVALAETPGALAREAWRARMREVGEYRIDKGLPGRETEKGWQRTAGESNPAGRNLWSYWLLSPDSFSEAHFATFPRELARRCISLGTSAYGCCAECGAPYARILERTHVGDTSHIRGNNRAGTSKNHNHFLALPPPNAGQNPAITIGWAPTCTHSAPVTACTVLDPFSGAGTTGVVAVGLGRRYLGIELSAEYVRMSERRIAQTQPALPGLAV